MSVPADGDPRKFQPKRVDQGIETSPTLRQVDNPNFPNHTIKTRKIAVLLADGFDDEAVDQLSKALLTEGAATKTIAPRLGVVKGAKGLELKVDSSFLTGASVLFDAVYIPGGDVSVESLKQIEEAREFVAEAFKHCKPIAASGAGVGFLAKSLGEKFSEPNTTGKLIVANAGVVTSRADVTPNFTKEFIKAISQHRHWEREKSSQ